MSGIPEGVPCAVADLCCAPGGKLLYIAELLMQSHIGLTGDRSVTGVDLDRGRLAQTAGAVRRAGLPNVQLVLGDACTIQHSPMSQDQLKWGQVHHSCKHPRVADRSGF